jgi:hypothetical protein
MKKIILWALILMSAATWSYAQVTNSVMFQVTAATTPNAGMTVQPTAAATPNVGVTTQPTAMATPAPSSTATKSSPWYLSIGGGIDIPARNWVTAYSLGGGGNVVVGYQLARDWAVELHLDNFIFSGSSNTTAAVSDYESRILPTVRYTIPTGSDIQPYVLVGLGMDVQILNGPSGNAVVTSFDIAPGLGLEWKMDSKLYLFGEGKWNILVANGPNNSTVTGQDIPVLAGVRLGL